MAGDLPGRNFARTGPEKLHELLDHVIAINGSHLKRLLFSYITYYHQDRTLWLAKTKSCGSWTEG